MRTLKSALAHSRSDEAPARRVLNVGGSSKTIAIPAHYADWDHLLLDIDPQGNPDVVCDARKLDTLAAHSYDAVYCSHNLEHYYRHDAERVLLGFKHVLKPDGFVEIRVPDLTSVMRACIDRGVDVNDAVYTTPAGPITAVDVIYGWQKQIRESGNDFFAHKNGFTLKSLRAMLIDAGFKTVYVAEAPEDFELLAIALVDDLAQWHKEMFKI